MATRNRSNKNKCKQQLNLVKQGHTINQTTCERPRLIFTYPLPQNAEPQFNQELEPGNIGPSLMIRSLRLAQPKTAWRRLHEHPSSRRQPNQRRNTPTTTRSSFLFGRRATKQLHAKNLYKKSWKAAANSTHAHHILRQTRRAQPLGDRTTDSSAGKSSSNRVTRDSAWAADPTARKSSRTWTVPENQGTDRLAYRNQNIRQGSAAETRIQEKPEGAPRPEEDKEEAPRTRDKLKP